MKLCPNMQIRNLANFTHCHDALITIRNGHGKNAVSSNWSNNDHDVNNNSTKQLSKQQQQNSIPCSIYNLPQKASSNFYKGVKKIYSRWSTADES